MTLLRPQPRAASINSPAQPLTSATLLQWLTGGRAAGVSVTEETVVGIPAVWRAVTLIAGTAASLPLHAFSIGAGGAREQLSAGPAADLLADPHPDMTAFELWELGYGSLALWGNAYYRRLRNSLGQLRELWWIAPNRVKPGRASDGTKIYVVDGDEENPLTDKELLHIPGFGYDGVCGIAPITAARQGLSLAIAAERYGARLFEGGSLATGILSTEQRLSPPEADALKKRWKEQNSGMESAHDVAVLGSGATFQQLSIPPEDAQFIESRRFQVQEVARIFGTPPHLLMDTSTSTSWGTGLEQMTLGWVKFSLRPYWLTRFEARLTKMLKPVPGTPRGAGADYVRYNLEGLLRGDSAARATFYRQMWEVGAYSTNEIREREDANPVPGGDQRFVPLNFGPLDGTQQTTGQEQQTHA